MWTSTGTAWALSRAIKQMQSATCDRDRATEEKWHACSAEEPGARVTHRKDCPEARTRSRHSSDRGQGMEAHRAGTEDRVRCPILPGRKEQANIFTFGCAHNVPAHSTRFTCRQKITSTQTTFLRRCPPSPGLFVFKILPVLFNCSTLRKPRPL
ncbi:hypothetical protein MC885_019116 [Smutsia gigantea]|nr:hypothetical protein MC885_019116 [Smutsia gigantea]